jgi:hypothetical protein
MNGMDVLNRRDFMKRSGLSSIGLGLYQAICRADWAASKGSAPPSSHRSLIILWLDGGPSQLETFDPHPGKRISGPTKAIDTSLSGVQFAASLPRLAEKMDQMSVIRSVVGTESDHARARYLLKTGYPISASLVHPLLGCICSAHLPPNECALPGYISMMSDFPAQAGYLGERFNPYGIQDPKDPLQNLGSRVPSDRLARRIKGLTVLEQALGQRNPEALSRTLGLEQTEQALAVMNSTDMKAFNYREEPTEIQRAYGDTSVGRGCLVARRLVEAGVRCVEVQFGGWDSHENNFTRQASQGEQLDAALSSLINDLASRKLDESTLVLCLGEFGRTPKIDEQQQGRDHWPKGFSVVMAGGLIQRGAVVGATDPEGIAPPADPVSVSVLFATVLAALGINPAIETFVGERPVKLSEGQPLASLILPS